MGDSEFLSLSGLSKSYAGKPANREIDLRLASSEIHALLGENGAGKSTLVKMIYGLVRPDAGVMQINGVTYHPKTPRDARAAGIGMVFQHFSLFEALSVAENIALGLDHPPPMRSLASQVEALAQEYGLPIDPAQIVGDLSAGERQRVEILRCLIQSPKLLIMDEPTSVLTPQEVDVLFDTLRKLAAQGVAVLYISHKLEEIKALCTRATILRGGDKITECDPRDVSAQELAELMVGRSFTNATRQARQAGEVMLELRDVSLPAVTAFGTPLRDLSLTLNAGQILGIGGVAGNGQGALFAALSGERVTAPGSVLLKGQDISAYGAEARRSLGLHSAPEERLGHAAVPDMSLTENIALTARSGQGVQARGFLNWSRASDFAAQVITRFRVDTPGVAAAAKRLSGGNLQKFVIGREILQDPDVLIINQPTWGVDAASAAQIRQELIALADRGVAVLCVSQDLDELIEISDQFAALNGGRLSAPVSAHGLTRQEMGLMIGGVDAAA